ncbi:MAG: glycosyltransferase family 4 protein [Bacteroidetes bacterium]|nr:glycosyltransferase family 4 protein [Bacteroidota bacterium]
MRRITSTTKLTTPITRLTTSRHLLFALSGNFFSNSRAVRQINALANEGANGLVIHCASPDTPTAYRGFRVVPLQITETSGPRLFAAFHRSFSRILSEVTADVFHASDLYCLPAVTARAKHLRAPIVFDSRELYHHVAATANRPHARLFWHLVQRRFLPQAQLVLTVSDAIADYLSKTYRISRPVVIPNVPESTSPSGVVNIREIAGLAPDAFVVLYVGNIRNGRGCDLLLEAASLCAPISVILLGQDQTDGALPRLAQRLGIDERVRFLDPIPPSDVLNWAAGADLGVSLLENSCLNHDFALPNKLFEYATAGVPVIASRTSEVERIVRTYDIGTVCAYSPDELARTIEFARVHPEILLTWKRNTASLVDDYNWPLISSRFISAYKSVCQFG